MFWGMVQGGLGVIHAAGHLCVLIHIWAGPWVAAIGSVWAFQWNNLADCSRAVLHCWLVITCWEKETSKLSVVMFNCVFVTFSCGILGWVWYLIVSIPDLYRLSYFHI